ncbi:hypothetical protein ACAX46_004453 [Providencia rettgeri]
MPLSSLRSQSIQTGEKTACEKLQEDSTETISLSWLNLQKSTGSVTGHLKCMTENQSMLIPLSQ